MNNIEKSRKMKEKTNLGYKNEKRIDQEPLQHKQQRQQPPQKPQLPQKPTPPKEPKQKPEKGR
jgi:hypothetical protein